MTSSDVEDREPKLMVLHFTDSHFQNVVKYNSDRSLEKLQTYNQKMAARTGKYAKLMETLTKAYTFDD